MMGQRMRGTDESEAYSDRVRLISGSVEEKRSVGVGAVEIA